MSDPLVTVENVTKTFEHEGQSLEVLKGIDLQIGDGEMVTIVGPSGAGKSTLLHLIGTLDLPTRGTIRYQGQDVTRLGSSDLAEFRNRSIGFVFQFHHLLPEFTALENVMMPGLIQGSRRLEGRARQLLDEVGLTHRLTHRPGELSGGEQQRVALARALLMEPKLVLADEPTGNLDSQSSDSVQKLFFEINRRYGTTFLIVTHSRDFAAMMPRQVAMRDGRIDSDERRPLSSTSPADQTPGDAAQPLENQGKPT
ncbi:MAG: ABC transporter ATP-binding protein [Myxococcales bacterium]|nr:ABC transporter ATP-binding protein [Myxococcales bacterium]MDH3844485.1 ABC transporter ATP-binding protein [Myxococcales bacterium]